LSYYISVCVGAYNWWMARWNCGISQYTCSAVQRLCCTANGCLSAVTEAWWVISFVLCQCLFVSISRSLIWMLHLALLAWFCCLPF